MNFVFISPHFPPNYIHFCSQLRKLGVNVLGIGDAPFETLDNSLKKALTEYYYIPNMENYDDILRACGHFTHVYGRIDRIESHNEHWLETDARLRDDFNVFGIRSSDVQRIKFKSHMKEEFNKANVNVPRGYVVNSIEEGQHLVQQVGYPIVAKPDKGVGAVGTYKIENEEQLQHFFSIKDKHPYMMQEYIEGKICSFDGLLNKNGEVVFYTVHQNCDNVMDIMHHNLHTAYYSLRHVDNDIYDQAIKILNVLGLPERFFHLEFFRRPSGELVVLEINMRPPGGLTLDMFNYANDIDIYKEWANVIVNNHFDAEYSRSYHCGYISRKFDREYTYTHEQILHRYHNHIVHHTDLEPMYWKAMGHYAYLVRDPHLDKIFEIKNYVHQLGHSNI
ncbi:acetyl-CoA carboxylase biotin carboxylase subunit family protein [Candidatus Uabimicrobium sp. HlEnr_7]|uniref:ATP-grasp domain-containing protein n=1 Tax=Candidatus Uabimicrobium helgolandensis TaxID=3095367 RepID=UPI00355886CC